MSFPFNQCLTSSPQCTEETSLCPMTQLTLPRASPDHWGESAAASLSSTDIDVWNATVKPYTNSRADTQSTQTPPASFQSRGAAVSDLQLQTSSLSPRLHPGNRLADSKSHHRQTSIVHGVQHSRNGSYASSNSPLSPQIIAAAGGERPDAYMGDPTFATAMSMSGMASGASFSSSSTLVPDRVSTATDVSSNAQKRVERMHSGRSRRDGHHHSHSRHHKGELKTVGEYALHVLFTSVSPFSLCIYRRPNVIVVYCTSRREDLSMCNCPH